MTDADPPACLSGSREIRKLAGIACLAGSDARRSYERGFAGHRHPGGLSPNEAKEDQIADMGRELDEASTTCLLYTSDAADE